MARKKKVKEEQAVTAEVVETKKKSSKKAPKTKMSAQKESIQETGVQEPIVKEENTKDSFKDKDYTIDELIDMLGPDIECENEAEVEDTSSSEKEDNGEDIFAALDDWNEDDEEEEISDEIIDMFDKTLEAKGLGDAYFERLERKIKEHEEAQKEREFYIDEVLNEE